MAQHRFSGDSRLGRGEAVVSSTQFPVNADQRPVRSSPLQLARSACVDPPSRPSTAAPTGRPPPPIASATDQSKLDSVVASGRSLSSTEQAKSSASFLRPSAPAGHMREYPRVLGVHRSSPTALQEQKRNLHRQFLLTNCSRKLLKEEAEPNRILHVSVHQFGWPITEEALREVFSMTGKVEKVIMLNSFPKIEALVQYQFSIPAMRAWDQFHGRSIYDAGGVMNIHFSDLDWIHVSSQKEDELNRILLVTIHHMLYPITVEVLHQVFSPNGYVEKVVTFQKSAGFQALIQYQSLQSAVSARSSLQGRNIYDGCCQLDIQFSNLDELQVNFNNERSRDFTNPSLPSEQKGRPSQSGYGDAAAFGGGLPPGVSGTNDRCTVLVSNLNPDRIDEDEKANGGFEVVADDEDLCKENGLNQVPEKGVGLTSVPTTQDTEDKEIAPATSALTAISNAENEVVKKHFQEDADKGIEDGMGKHEVERNVVKQNTNGNEIVVTVTLAAENACEKKREKFGNSYSMEELEALQFAKKKSRGVDKEEDYNIWSIKLAESLSVPSQLSEREYAIFDRGKFIYSSNTRSRRVISVSRCLDGGEIEGKSEENGAVFKSEMLNKAVHVAARGGNLEILTKILGDYSFLYKMARLGNSCYRLQNPFPGQNTYGPKGMRVVSGFMQGERILSDLDIISTVGANKPLQLVDTRVSIKNDRMIVIRFEGVNGIPRVRGICIRKAPNLPASLMDNEFFICINCAAEVEVPSVQRNALRMKSTVNYEKKIQELSTQCQRKTDEKPELDEEVYADGKRWGYFPGMHPKLSFSNFIDSFFRKGKCSMRSFMVWNSPPWAFSVRRQRGLESLLHHREACWVVFSETIELKFFDGLAEDGFKIAVAMPNPDELWKDTSAHVFASMWGEWRKTALLYCLMNLESTYGKQWLENEAPLLAEQYKMGVWFRGPDPGGSYLLVQLILLQEMVQHGS